jgi:hypothetical protein
MKSKFKFFRGYIGTLDIMDGETYATASLHHPRLDSNNEMERWFAERDLQTISQEQYNLNRDMFAQQEIVRRRRIDTDNQIRLFQTTTTVTVNPTPWTKVKIFGTRVKLVLIETWKLEPIGVVVVTLLVSVVTFIGVMKLFGA